MADISTSYMGLKLKNPIIVTSSGMTSEIDRIKLCEDSGAGAVILKSLFEEKITSEVNSLMGSSDVYQHSEAYDYLSNMGKEFELSEYCKLIENSKKELSIPVIASINCVKKGEWMDYAERISQTGADALELNVFLMTSNTKKSGNDTEKEYFDIIATVVAKSKIPVAIKMSNFFTNPANIIKRLEECKVKGISLFNKFYRPDIDIEELKVVSSTRYTRPEDVVDAVRWLALMSPSVKCDFMATTGVHTYIEAVKVLLSGAKAAGVCSTLYLNGLKRIAEINEGISNWMDAKGFLAIEDFRGNLAVSKDVSHESFERFQFIKTLNK